MNFVVLGRDRAGGEARARHRAGHLRYVAGHQAKIVYAGPLLDGGRMVGSLFVFDVADRAALDSYLAEDPYFDPGIFESVEIWESRWMVPERQPGFLEAEAERAEGRSPAAAAGGR
ncbi:MAG TPA: YciI family protein [Allosphingosinicella sp.]|nr:YciI family protein [Allosphingosinicella sp.]